MPGWEYLDLVNLLDIMQLPELFKVQAQLLFESDYSAFEQSLSEESPVSIRLNPFKKEIVNQEIADFGTVPWCDAGFYLPSRPLFTADPLFHAGCYYVQEASSMFVEQIVKNLIKDPVVCLDLCAAPGGKSTHLSTLLPEGSLLVSNEVIRSRANILSENLIKWGKPSSIITQNDPEEIGRLESFFDLILTDVPCSGEGMFRKDPQAMEEWSPGNVKLCAERQRRILANIWPSLKPGGFLIYSTCTYNTSENEENIHWLIKTFGASPVEIPVQASWKISGSRKEKLPVYRFFPHLTKGEGFFIAVLQKPIEEMIHSGKYKKLQAKQKQQPAAIPEECKKWLKKYSDFNMLLKNNSIIAIPNVHMGNYRQLEERLRIISAGITLGTIKGKDLIPDHAIAMSNSLNKDAFPSHEVDKETAIQYLSKEAIHSLPSETDKGYVLLTYRQHPIGFVKNIGNRANNLYPQEWRIRMRIS